MKKYILLILISITIFSCEKTVDNIEIPNGEAKLVCQAFINADSAISKLYLSWSNPIFGENRYQFDTEKNATVKISRGSDVAVLPYVNDPGMMDGYYVLNQSVMDIQAGDHLELKIKTQAGDSISSFCDVPQAADYTLTYTGLDSIKESFNIGYYRYYYNFKVVTQSKDVYLHLGVNGLYFDGTNQYEESLYDNSENNGLYYIKANQQKVISFETWKPQNELLVYEAQTDASYYLYHKSVMSFEGENPFSEPVIIYSNIDNGLGVFCSYLQNVTHYKL